jgi:DNA-nicking Smr family endonuclease
MAARKDRIDRSKPRSLGRKPCLQAFYTPFDGLDQHFPKIFSHLDTLSAPQDPSPEQPERQEDPDLLFRDAMAGVKPFGGEDEQHIPPPTPAKTPPRFLAQEEAEVRRHLVELVSGEAPFELWYSDEYVDGAVAGLSPALIKNLKKGLFSYQDYVDLHGCKREEAREKVNEFVTRSFVRKLRCVLIVSGRGLNSREREPVLKQELVRWLTHAPLRRMVLAFASARSYDGGAGAFYVLLRRKEGKAPFVFPAR